MLNVRELVNIMDQATQKNVFSFNLKNSLNVQDFDQISF